MYVCVYVFMYICMYMYRPMYVDIYRPTHNMVHLPGIISIYGKVYILTEMGRELKSPPLPPVAMSLGPHVEFKNSP